MIEAKDGSCWSFFDRGMRVCFFASSIFLILETSCGRMHPYGAKKWNLFSGGNDSKKDEKHKIPETKGQWSGGSQAGEYVSKWA